MDGKYIGALAFRERIAQFILVVLNVLLRVIYAHIGINFLEFRNQRLDNPSVIKRFPPGKLDLLRPWLLAIAGLRGENNRQRKN